VNTPVVKEARPHILDSEALGDHFDRLFRAAWALCSSREDAEDLVQETFARVLARPRALRNDDDAAYLSRVLRNTFISGRRAAARRPHAAAADPEALDLPDLGATDPLVVARTREILVAIDALPAEFRDTLVAVDVAGLSYGEAATALRVQGGTIKSRLFRARDQVARALTGSGKPVQTPEPRDCKEGVPA
jgi:RNA polymerase sigma-70 factor (ECF subfamily)